MVDIQSPTAEIRRGK